MFSETESVCRGGDVPKVSEYLKVVNLVPCALPGSQCEMQPPSPSWGLPCQVIPSSLGVSHHTVASMGGLGVH